MQGNASVYYSYTDSVLNVRGDEHSCCKSLITDLHPYIGLLNQCRSNVPWLQPCRIARSYLPLFATALRIALSTRPPGCSPPELYYACERVKQHFQAGLLMFIYFLGHPEVLSMEFCIRGAGPNGSFYTYINHKWSLCSVTLRRPTHHATDSVRDCVCLH